MAGYENFHFAGTPKQPRQPTYPSYNVGRTFWTPQLAKAETNLNLKTGNNLLAKLRQAMASALLKQTEKTVYNVNLGYSALPQLSSRAANALWPERTRQSGPSMYNFGGGTGSAPQVPGINAGQVNAVPWQETTDYLKSKYYGIGTSPRSTSHHINYLNQVYGDPNTYYYPEYDSLALNPGDVSPYVEGAMQDVGLSYTRPADTGSGYGGYGGYSYPQYNYGWGGGGGGGGTYKSASTWYNTLVNWNIGRGK